MVSKELLLAFVSAALPKALAYSRAGRDWRYLDDFIDSVRQGQENATEAQRLRAEGTFWNVVPGAAKNFPTEWETESDENARGVAFYYPAMAQRAASKDAGDLPEQTWGVPFAVAPFYGKNVVPASHRESPAYVPKGPDNSSVVFHQMSGNEGFKDDIYVLFTNSPVDKVNPEQRLADFTVALVGVAGTLYHRGDILIKMHWDQLNVGEWTQEFREMVEAYVNHHHDGMVPNPWALGIGSPAWPEFTGINTFWGYDDKGRYITEPPVGN